MCARKYCEGVAIEIEPNGAFWRVIHNHPNRAAEGWKHLRNSAGLAREFRKFLPNAGNCLLDVAHRDRCRVEVDAQKPFYSDESGNKDRVRHCSLREDDGMRPKRSTPNRLPRLLCGLLGFGCSATCLFDCVLDHFGWHIKRGG